MSLREDVAREYSRMVDRMVKNLAKEDGITGVIREDREVLLVTTPSWNPAQLQEWVTRYLQNIMRGQEFVTPGMLDALREDASAEAGTGKCDVKVLMQKP
ncbi:MAG: hypothetical protein U1D68_05935 [Arthrobacter sp.]|nr:hypothetical protein [Arthrobacter sp.]MDZ4352694.1 hypothetical protein [Arthrobacter sp.]